MRPCFGRDMTERTFGGKRFASSTVSAVFAEVNTAISLLASVFAGGSLLWKIIGEILRHVLPFWDIFMENIMKVHFQNGDGIILLPGHQSNPNLTD